MAIFTIRDSEDTIVAAVGVNSAELRQNFQGLADTTGLFDTALALVSPLEPEEGEEEEPTVVRISLRDGNGFFLASTEIELLAREHTALFLTQLFADVKGIDELEGRLEISVSSSQDYVAALSLRSAREKLTSVPLFLEQHPFAPTLLFEFAQDLKATSPAARLTLHQNDRDSALEFVSARMPGVQLLSENFRGGEQFGFGYLNRPARSVLLVAGEVVSSAGVADSVAFTMINEGDDGFAIQGNGMLLDDGQGSLLFDLQYLGKTPNTCVGDDADIVIHLGENLFRIPDASQTTVHAEFVSVSRSSETEKRILRRTEQSLDFMDPDPVLANLESLVPSLLVAGESLTIAGSNFDEEPAVLFPGKELKHLAFQREDDSWGVIAPAGVIDGPLRVDNGEGPGNGYRVQSLYGPILDYTIESPKGTEEIRLTFIQEENLYPMIQFQGSLLIESASLEDLSLEQMVGSIRGNAVNANLFVAEVETDRVVLDILFELGNSSEGKIILEVLEQDGLQLLSLDHQPEFFSETISFLLRETIFEVVFTGLPVTFPAAGNPVFATAKTISGVTGADGLDSVLTSFTSDAFLLEGQP